MSSLVINQNLSPCINERLDADLKARCTKEELIKRIGIISLKELAAASVFGGVSAFFVTSPGGIFALAVGTVGILSVNLILRISALFCYLICQNDKSDSGDGLNPYTRTHLELVEYLAPLGFSNLSTSTIDTVIHETGHAIVAKVMYLNAKVKITLRPFVGGVTTYFVTHLSKIGAFVGRNRASLIVAGAGPAAAILAATTEIGLAHSWKEKYPTLSRYLNIMAIVNIASHVLYAISAFSQEAKKVAGHDFVKLWQGGIHPVVSVISIVAIPLITKIGLFAIEKNSMTSRSNEGLTFQKRD